MKNKEKYRIDKSINLNDEKKVCEIINSIMKAGELNDWDIMDFYMAIYDILISICSANKLSEKEIDFSLKGMKNDILKRMKLEDEKKNRET